MKPKQIAKPERLRTFIINAIPNLSDRQLLDIVDIIQKKGYHGKAN